MSCLSSLFYTALITGALLAPSAPYAAAEGPEKRDPQSIGRVAIVPFIHRTGDNLASLGGAEPQSEAMEREKLKVAALDEVEEQLREHAFAFVPRAEMTAALNAVSLALERERDRTIPMLTKLASQLGVRYVVTGVLHIARSEVEVNRTLSSPYWEARHEGVARVQFQVFDHTLARFVPEFEATKASRDRGRRPHSPLLARADRLAAKAVRDATRKSMQHFIERFATSHD